MSSSLRPVTGIDHVAKEVVIHVGLVFEGHLNIERLGQAASEITTVYPELHVVAKRRWWPFGLWHTPPATRHAWSFQHRDLPEKRLADVFAPAAAASEIDLLTAKKITHLGIANLSDMLELFSFDRPNISSLGWSEVPILDFRATLLGDSSDGGHTLLTLIVPHLITDAGGAASIVEAWGKLYHGEPVAKASGESHPDLLRLLNPVVAAQAKVNQEEEGRGTGWSSGLFAVALWLRELIQHQKNGPEDHYIHFPAVVLEKYRDEARKLSSNEHEGLPVSRYDIFTAMIIKLLANSTAFGEESKPFDFYGVHSLLPAFPQDSLPSPYLHNLNTPGWHPLPSSTELRAMPVPKLAVKLRTRLNALRQPGTVHEVIQKAERNPSAILVAPRADATHGWGMVTSWQAIDKQARVGFDKEKLLFLCPQNQMPGDMVMPSTAWPFGDGAGGMFTRLTTPKGDWETMWEKTALNDLG